MRGGSAGNADTRLATLEAEARAAHRGLWTENDVLDAERVDIDPSDDEHIVAPAQELEAEAGPAAGARLGPDPDLIVRAEADQREGLAVDRRVDELAVGPIDERDDLIGGRVDQLGDQQVLSLTFTATSASSVSSVSAATVPGWKTPALLTWWTRRIKFGASPG